MVIRSVIASLAELKRGMLWATDFKSESAEIWCRKSAGQFLLREQLQFIMLLASDGSHVGNLGLFAFNWPVKKCEIGYWLATPHCGNGYMTEAVNALAHFAFDKLDINRVELHANARNLPSCRVAERCGYTLEGTSQMARLDNLRQSLRPLPVRQAS